MDTSPAGPVPTVTRLSGACTGWVVDPEGRWGAGAMPARVILWAFQPPRRAVERERSHPACARKMQAL